MDGGGHEIFPIFRHLQIGVASGGAGLGVRYLHQADVHRKTLLVIGVSGVDKIGHGPGFCGNARLDHRVSLGQSGQGLDHRPLGVIGPVGLVQLDAIALSQGFLLGGTDLLGGGIQHRHEILLLVKAWVVYLALIQSVSGDARNIFP